MTRGGVSERPEHRELVRTALGLLGAKGKMRGFAYQNGWRDIRGWVNASSPKHEAKRNRVGLTASFLGHLTLVAFVLFGGSHQYSPPALIPVDVVHTEDATTAELRQSEGALQRAPRFSPSVSAGGISRTHQQYLGRVDLRAGSGQVQERGSAQKRRNTLA
jgi:hypothetical protein